MTNSSRHVLLNGNSLTIDDIVAVGIGDKDVELDPSALKKCSQSRQFLEEEIQNRKIIYGVNTSFGPMCNKIIPDHQIQQLQENLIRSHAAGLGEPFQHYIARAVLLIRLNTLIKGYSGVRISLLEFIRDVLNRGLAPYIPSNGSVGASGDLVHLAHAALLLIGEGKAFYRGELMTAMEALKKAGLSPYKLSYKEGIALINGTSAMTALAAFNVFSTKKLLHAACVSAAFAVEIFGGIDDAWDEDLHLTKPHPGQIKIASIVRSLYQGSQNIRSRSSLHTQIRGKEPKNEDTVFETPINVQDVYSIRCTPQILGPVWEAWVHAKETVEIEANSSNDNPIIISEKRKIIHGGNFHGQHIAFVMDMLRIGIATLCNLSERRLNKLLDPKLNEGLPEHLIQGTVGLEMGFMGAQYLATSSTAENRHLANPMSIHTISCNASNQDVVSMGTVAARETYRQVSNAKHILTLELLADLQALRFRNRENMGIGTSRIYALLAPHFPGYECRQIFHDHLVRFRKLLFSSKILDDLSVYLE